MVVFVDLDDPDEVENQHQRGYTTPFDMRGLIDAHAARSLQNQPEKDVESDFERNEEEQEHPNLNALSAVLGNYPFVNMLFPRNKEN